MKGRNPTAEERRHLAWVCSLGCYCCGKMGVEPWPDGTLPHHVEGKTKPGAHFKVIPLCDAHHSRYKIGGFHNNPTDWQSVWGDQYEILAEIGRE